MEHVKRTRSRFRKIVLLLIMLFMISAVPVFAKPDPYRTEDEILQDFFSLQNSYSDVLVYEVIGETVEGKEIYLFKLGNPDGVKVFIDASMHGHEYITTEALYYCVEWFLTERTDILQTNYVLFVPILNRDSYRIGRTNTAGVDLNRNYPTYWKYNGYGTIYYSGPSPLSEPETQAIHNALANYNPRWYINLHAGYAETRITPPSIEPIYEEVYSMIRDTSRNTFGVNPFPYDTYQFYEGMARYEGEAQGAYTWEIEISSCNPSLGYFYDRVVPRLKAVFIETFLEGVSEPNPEPNQPPVADANGPYTGTEDVIVTFDGVGSSDPDGDSLIYKWDFGDGTTLEDTSETTTHTYTTGLAGQTNTYTVSLVVNDGKADSPPAETTATIMGVNDSPIADANGPYSGVIDEEIIFDATESSDEEGISSYMWDFGDGTVGSGATPTHSYTAAGAYIVHLTVEDTEGALATATTTAEVTQAPAQPTSYTSIDMSREDKTRGQGWLGSRALAMVSVKVEELSLKGATVYGSWSEAIETTVVGITNGEGKVMFRTGWVKDAGVFTFTVTKVEKDGVNYVLQGEISDSI